MSSPRPTIKAPVFSPDSLNVRPFVRLSFVRPSVRLTAHPSIRLPGRQSVRPSISLSVRPAVWLSVCPTDRPSVRPSIRLPTRQSIYTSQKSTTQIHTSRIKHHTHKHITDKVHTHLYITDRTPYTFNITYTYITDRASHTYNTDGAPRTQHITDRALHLHKIYITEDHHTVHTFTHHG